MENCNFKTSSKDIRVTLVNRASSRLSSTSNFKYENKSFNFELDMLAQPIKKVISIVANPKVINYSLMQTPDSAYEMNADGTLLTGAQIGVNGKVDQVIEYEGSDRQLYRVSKGIPFSTFVVLDRDFDFNKTPSINIIVEDIQLEVKEGTTIIESLSIFVEVF